MGVPGGTSACKFTSIGVLISHFMTECTSMLPQELLSVTTGMLDLPFAMCPHEQSSLLQRQPVP